MKSQTLAFFVTTVVLGITGCAAPTGPSDSQASVTELQVYTTSGGGCVQYFSTLESAIERDYTNLNFYKQYPSGLKDVTRQLQEIRLKAIERHHKFSEAGSLECNQAAVQALWQIDIALNKAYEIQLEYGVYAGSSRSVRK